MWNNLTIGDIVEFLFVFIIGVLISIFELAFIYAASPKKFELKIIDNNPIAIIYTSYFFLPFTTKIRKYKNIQEAYITSRIEKRKHSSCTVYDLMLKFPKKSIVLFGNKNNKNDILTYCDKINKSINSFEDCIIEEPAIASKKTAVIILLVCSPFLIFIPPKHSRNSYITDITQNFHIYLIATGILAIFMILSLLINLFINVKSDTNLIVSSDYNKKENIDLDHESKRINDSIIKY